MPGLPSGVVNVAGVAAILNVDEQTVRVWSDLGALHGGFHATYDELVFQRGAIEVMAEPLRGADDVTAAAPPEESVLFAIEQVSHVVAQLTAKRFEQEARFRPLFHYTSAGTALDFILRDARLRLGTPTRTNDPFESDPHLVNFTGELTIPHEELPELWSRASNALRDRCRLACLTRSGPDEWASLMGFGDGYRRARMWTQYADNHAGVCLAFDQDRLRAAARAAALERGLRLYAARVRYRAPNEREFLIQFPLSRAIADLRSHVDEVFPTAVAGLYFTKAWDWSTESEYRLLLDGDVADEEFVDISGSLTGIFCGSRFPEARFDDLRARCSQLLAAGRIFVMRWRNGFPIPMPLAATGQSTDASWDVPPEPAEPEMSAPR